MICWEMQADKTVRHSQGYTITLNRGTWSEPYDISVDFPRELEGKHFAKLVREGMAFAGQRAFDGAVLR